MISCQPFSGFPGRSKDAHTGASSPDRFHRAQRPDGHLRPHRRESLAGLLWPDYPERSARTNLSNALSNLRTALGDREANVPFFHVSRETIQFNVQSDCWVDQKTFQSKDNL